MALLFDKYIPQEGFNTIFSDIKNCDIEIRPSQEGFQTPLFFLKKRKGLWTNGVRWKTNGKIISSKKFNDKTYMYTDKGFIYSFDGTDLVSIQGIPDNVAYSVSTSSYTIDTSGDLGLLQEFTSAKESVVRKISVKLKHVPIYFLGGSHGQENNILVKCSLYSPNGTSTEIDSNTIISYTQLTEDYQVVDFYFNNAIVPAGKGYFRISVEGSDNYGSIVAGYSSAQLYVGHKLITLPGRVDTGGTLWFVVEQTSGFTVDTTNFDENILSTGYIGGGRYPSDSQEYTVSSYNATTGEITFSETSLSSSFIGKYMYIATGSTAKYQQKAIVASTANNKLTPSTVFSVAPVAGDKVWIYNSIEQHLFFPQLRKGSTSPDVDSLVSIDIYGNISYRYFPGKRMLTYWDNRVIQLTKDRHALIYSSNTDFEIPMLASVSFGNSKALNMTIYGGYILLFFQDKIGLVKKDIINSELGTFSYIYQDLLDVGLYSPNSFIIQGGDMYIFANDKRLYAVDLSTISLGEIFAKLSDQGETLMNHFDDFVGGDVRMHYDSGTLYVVYRGTDDKSKVFKYLNSFKSWIVDEYSIDDNFLGMFYSIGQDKFTYQNNYIYKFSGSRDITQPIEQKIKMYGPVQGLFDLFTLILIKIRLGFDGTAIGGTVNITIGGMRKAKASWDLTSIQAIKDINASIQSDGTQGSNIVGFAQYGGENVYYNNIQEIFSEMLDVSLKVGKKGSYFTVEMINDTDKQMMVGGIIPYYNTNNPLSVYNKGVLK